MYISHIPLGPEELRIESARGLIALVTAGALKEEPAASCVGVAAFFVAAVATLDEIGRLLRLWLDADALRTALFGEGDGPAAVGVFGEFPAVGDADAVGEEETPCKIEYTRQNLQNLVGAFQEIRLLKAL
jgi:hypothetical protein